MDNNINIINRAKKFALGAAIILIAGLLYFAIIKILGFGISCPFYALTGLKCPGCGITTMIICLASGDFTSAFNANPVTFCLGPFIIALIIYLSYRYIRFGDAKLNKALNTAIIIICVIYIVFGIIRNIYPILIV
ncbi:MAG: DUF2752 domain-containing protein [Coriobacteriales bacterium]|nr:DUF2752 domain-containing protein [Coriobacteriales bacterium]